MWMTVLRVGAVDQALGAWGLSGGSRFSETLLSRVLWPLISLAVLKEPTGRQPVMRQLCPT